jgi:ABC-type Na+ efflux pump permease subunit
MHLIGEWFQPEMNVGASIVGPLSCFIAYGTLRRSSTTDARVCAVWAFGLFSGLLCICLIFQNTLGVVWSPQPVVLVSVWVAWAVCYLALASAFCVALVAATLSAMSPDNAAGT